MMHIEPITLTGKHARLEPLGPQHAPDLYAACKDDPQIWTYMPIKPPTSQHAMETIIASALREQEAGTQQPFAIIDLARSRAVGSTRYLDIRPNDHGVEIGWTWLGPMARRTGINTECKYLLLRYAFETLKTIRVCLKTHHLNLRSQQAIERIGAQKEGVLRNHVIMPDGHYRHSVYYSIIDSEWPRVKTRLETMMNQHP